MQTAGRNAQRTRAARHLEREILIAIGGVLGLGGLADAKRQRAISLGGNGARIQLQQQSSARGGPLETERDRRDQTERVDEILQLPRGCERMRWRTTSSGTRSTSRPGPQRRNAAANCSSTLGSAIAATRPDSVRS